MLLTGQLVWWPVSFLCHPDATSALALALALAIRAPTSHLPPPPPSPRFHRQPADEDGLSFPPYSINVGSGRWPLHSKTLPMNARHHSGAVQYDVHNMNGLLEVRTSHLAMKSFLGKRPFILSRCGAGEGAAAGDAMSWSSVVVHVWCMVLPAHLARRCLVALLPTVHTW